MIASLLIAIARLLVAGPKPAASTQQRIYIANHTSHLDAVLLLSTLPYGLRRKTRPVAAADYWNANRYRKYVIDSVFRGVLVDREHGSLNPLEPAMEALRNSDSLILFPEGTRGPGRDLQPLKPGIFHLARMFPHIDIVPAWIDNSYRSLPKGFTVPRPLLCSIRFGEPLRWRVGLSQDAFLMEVRNALLVLRPGAE